MPYRPYQKRKENKQFKTLILEIQGMSCASCASQIAELFRDADGIMHSDVRYKEGRGIFTYDPDRISEDAIKKSINSTGMYKVSGNTEEQFRPGAEIGKQAKSNDAALRYDLIIIGGGSAAFSAASKAIELKKSTLIINAGLPVGGTCVNVGCVPSKYLIRAAESVRHASYVPYSGIDVTPPLVRFDALIREKKELVATMRKKKYTDVASGMQGFALHQGWASFKDEHTVMAGGRQFTAKHFLIATGASPNIPPIEGLKETGFHTSASLFDLEEKPESLSILGAGYVGMEIAMAYRRLGVKIRMLEFSDRVLRSQMQDISEEIQKHMLAEGIELFPDHRIRKVGRDGKGRILIEGINEKTGEGFVFTEPGHLVVATGIRPNTSKLGLENIGVQCTPKGHVSVNEYMQTSRPHIYAAGDCTDKPAFVYTAAKEGMIAAANAFADEKKSVDYNALPWVVFTDPQIAGAGMDEREAEMKNIPYEATCISLSEVPKAIVAKDTRGMIKLIRDTETDRLIGARMIASEAGELAMQISQAIQYGITITQLAEYFYPYLTLSEGIKIAAISFRKDVATLSCCAH